MWEIGSFSTSPKETENAERDWLTYVSFNTVPRRLGSGVLQDVEGDNKGTSGTVVTPRRYPLDGLLTSTYSLRSVLVVFWAGLLGSGLMTGCLLTPLSYHQQTSMIYNPDKQNVTDVTVVHVKFPLQTPGHLRLH